MKQHELIALSEVSLFRKVDILDLESFFKNRSLAVEQFEKNDFVAHQGDHYDKLIVILDGECAALMAAPGGKQVRIETLKGPAVAASAVLFSSQQALPVSLQAAGALHCLKIPKETVLELMQAFSPLLEAYLKENGDKLIFLSEKLRLFQFKSLRQKIVGHLLMLLRRQGGGPEIRLMYNKEEMAQLMGVARPSLSREFSALVQEGLIESKGKVVRISGPEKLQAILEKD